MKISSWCGAGSKKSRIFPGLTQRRGEVLSGYSAYQKREEKKGFRAILIH